MDVEAYTSLFEMLEDIYGELSICSLIEFFGMLIFWGVSIYLWVRSLLHIIQNWDSKAFQTKWVLILIATTLLGGFIYHFVIYRKLPRCQKKIYSYKQLCQREAINENKLAD